MPASPEMRRRRRRLLVPGAVLLAVVVGVLVLSARDQERTPRPSTPAPRTTPDVPDAGTAMPSVAWRRSRAVGRPNGGRLVRGVQLPAEGQDWFTWDPVRKHIPNRPGRRWGTDRLVRTLLRVLREYRAANPGAPRVGIGDLSRPRGGEFGRRFGGLGHASHQNGLDADVYYPRRDGRERRPYAPRQVDRALAQDLVDRFAAAGAEYVFVGPRLRLRGRRGVVEALVNHDDHLHLRVRRR
jgi:murein endopeptidase